ncbi:hypothetical protein ACJ73_02896 [Blastomyces percursus]|uniref:Major facilitator superfamily (MFS) profile domain-containing protein n=1 Tax=Blastomyces percursus TaxID=1658174 RepID=A0A1J9QZZ4_9EURO|nr:hypothetical protein ACJ73_02896 [Blastomyces percursus]
MNVKHQEGGKNDIVLASQPSNDPNDPLNWTKLRKEYNFWLLWIWGFLAVVCVNWGGPVWTQFTIYLKTRGCILGRFQTTVQMYWGVTGFGAAPAGSLVQISKTDIFFAHEKGTRLSLYVFTIYAGSFLGPVAAGHITHALGWHWCYQYLIIFFSVLLVIQLFTMEESTFRRPPTSSESGDTAAMSHHAKQNLEAVKVEAYVSHDDDCDTSEDSTPPAPKSYWRRMGLYSTSYSDPRPVQLQRGERPGRCLSPQSSMRGYSCMAWVLKGTMWIPPAGFGMVFIAFGIGSGGAIAITYAVDCYPLIASENLVLMLFIRNIIGCGFTFASQ